MRYTPTGTEKKESAIEVVNAIPSSTTEHTAPIEKVPVLGQYESQPPHTEVGHAQMCRISEKYYPADKAVSFTIEPDRRRYSM